MIYEDMYKKPLEKEFYERFPEDTYATAEVLLHIFYNIYNKSVGPKIIERFLLPKGQIADVKNTGPMITYMSDISGDDEDDKRKADNPKIEIIHEINNTTSSTEESTEEQDESIKF